MKKQFKRFSKSTLAVLLSVCLLISCMTVGIIATDAAQDDSEAVGAHFNLITVYYAPNFTPGASSVFKANYKSGYATNWNTGSQSGAAGSMVVMTDSGKTYNDHPVYYAQIYEGGNDAASTHGLDQLQFQYFENGTDYTSHVSAVTSWTNGSKNGQLYYGTDSSWKTTWSYDAVPLAAPSITYDDSDDDVTETATEGVNATISWAAVPNAATYTVYKGEDVVSANQPETTYSFAKSYASNGTYKVVAEPDGADSAHTKSVDSNTIQFTFNKTTLATPVVTATDTDTNLTILSPAELNASSGQVTFSWSKVNNAESYVVKKGDTTIDTISATSASTYSCSVNKLEGSTGNYTVQATSTKTNYFTNSNASTPFSLTISKQTLDTPQNVALDKVTLTIPPTEEITLSWSPVANAGSYTVYLDGVEKASNVDTNSYAFMSLYLNAGTYTVRAVPSPANANYYNSSDISEGATLAVNKTPVAAPELTLNGGTADVTGDVGTAITAKIENYTALSDKLDFALYRGSSSGTLDTKVADFTGATLVFTPDASTADYNGLDTYYTVKATIKAAAADDYTLPDANQKSNSVKTTLTKAIWKLMGETNKLVNGDANTTWGTANSKFVLDTYVRLGVYSITFTVGNNDAYIALCDTGSNNARYAPTDGDTEVDGTGIAEEDRVVTYSHDNKGTLKFTKNKEYTLYMDQDTHEIWIDADQVKISTKPYYRNYDSNGEYVDPVEGTTGGTSTPASATTVDKGSTNTLTATPVSGYHFVGWYSSTDFTAEPLSTDATYTSYTAARTATVYALFDKNTYTVTVAPGSNGTVAANSVNSGSVPVLLPAATPNEGYVFLNWTTSDATLTLRNETSANGATVAATGAGTVTANFAPAVAASAQVKGDGVGTVTINGVADTNNVPQGGQVTFVATPGDNCSFYGWFTDAECTPANRVSTNRTFTTTVSSAVTYYALINFSSHKLWGHGALLHWGDGKADLGSADITFTQSSSDARIYNVKVDMKRTTNVAVSVYPGSPNTYEAATDGNGSGTAASGTRVNYDTGTTKKWHVLDETDVKGLNFEWNALTKTLSWTETTIDPDEYTVVYVKELNDSNNAYVWSGDTKVFGNYPGAALNTFPQVQIGEDYYRVIYLTKDSVGGNDTFSVNINKGQDNTGTNFTGLEIGKSYTVARTNTGTGTDTGSPVVTHEGLTARTLNVTVPKVNGDTVATAYISAVNGVATENQPTSLNNVYRGDDIEVTYTFAEGMEPNYDYSSTSGVTGATESSKVISFQMPNADTVAKVNFVEYDDTIYISDKAGWGSIKLHIWNNNNSTTWDTWDSEPIMSKSTDTWTALDYGEGHNVRYKYDADKELYLVRGLSQSKGSMANFLIRNSGGTSQTNNITDTEIGALYKTIDDSGNAHYKSAENFDYDTYDPYEVVWPPEDAASLTNDANMYIRFSNNDSFASNDSNEVHTTGKVKGGDGTYWYDLTDLVLKDYSSWSNIYFFLASNNTDSDVSEGVVQGNTNNEIVDGYDSTNYTGTQDNNSDKNSIDLPKSGTKLLGALRQSRGNVGNNKDYVQLNSIDRTKLTHVGVLVTSVSGGAKKYKIYYTSAPAGSKSKTVKVYAKDSTLRSGYSIYNAQATTNLTDDAYATTPKYYEGGTGTAYSVTRYNDDYDYAPAVPKGTTIYFKTQMANGALDSGVDNDYFNTDYYLKGYSINGTVYQLHTGTGDEAGGLYKESFTIPEDWPYDYVEITPIYWRRDTTNTMVFYVQGYTDEVRDAGWGNTIGVYPFYQDEFNVAAKGSQNAYGGYPGQPLVNYKGDLFAQIPVQYAGTNENGVKKTMYIKGITMSNMFWDYVHLATGEVDKHHQTYDYDDLYKIYQEKKENGESPDNIICSFKYENKHNNDEPSTLTTTEAGLAVYSNGWEDLTDFSGNKVDIFGHVLSAEQQNNDPLYVISQDYRSNCAGRYATEWAVYDEDGDKVTTIVPSALILNSVADFDNYDAETLKFKDEYQILDTATYKNRPVKITYEQSIWGGSDQAERCDARWYYSWNDTPVSAEIKIQVSEDNGKTWTDATGLTNSGTCDIAGISAVFDAGTRASASDLIHTDPTLTLDKEEYYRFTATQSADYKFDSWQVERDGAIQQVTNVLGEDEEIAPRSGNAVFIARFKHVVNNKFSLYHEIHQQSAGVGTVNITAQKYETGTKIANVATAYGDSLSGTSVTFDVANNETRVILATFTATPRADSTFDDFYETASKILTNTYNKGLDYILDFEIDTENNQFKILYDIDKLYSGTTMSHSSDTFYSRFGFKERDYKIDYFFDTFKYGKKVYTVTGTITSEDATNYFKDQLATDIGFTSLNASFVSSKTPAESNYREDLKWNSSDVEILPDEGTTLRAKLVADQTPYNVCRAKIVDNYNGNEITKIIETTYKSHFIDPDTHTDYVAQNTEHISYWSVYKYKGGSDMVEIARCYGSSFNYTAYEDYYIVAQYDKLDEGVSRQDAYNAQTKGYASLVSISRNHWNNCAKEESGEWQVDSLAEGSGYSEANKEFDRLYSDFILGYDYNGLDLSVTGKQGYSIQYKIEKYIGDTKKSEQTINVSAVDNKNRVHCTLGIGNTEENADYNTEFRITPMLVKNGTDYLSGKATTIKIKFYSIANSEREWVD